MASQLVASGLDETQYTHYIAIDFGTSGCGAVLLTSASEKPRLFSKWLTSQIAVGIKSPTVLLLDHNKECEAFGLKARLNYYKKSIKHSNEFKNYYLFEHFKMNLYEEKVLLLILYMIQHVVAMHRFTWYVDVGLTSPVHIAMPKILPLFRNKNQLSQNASGKKKKTFIYACLFARVLFAQRHILGTSNNEYPNTNAYNFLMQ